MMSFIATEAAKTVIAITTTAIVGGVVWMLNLRRRTNSIKALISNTNRNFILYYRGEADPESKKTITFNSNGAIGEGSNSNEHYWEVSYGTLKLFTSGKKIFSQFKWDAKIGRLVHTNNPRLPSVMGQYIVPSFIPANEQGDIYAH